MEACTMRSAHLNAMRRSPQKNNRGVILIIALIVLVAMSLGGIAIMRSVDSTTLIAGNLAFKQRALHASDTGVTAALNWLLANKATLASDNTGVGYYSSSPESFDWANAASWTNKTVVGTDAANNQVSYVIHRMCTCANTAYNGTCIATGLANQCGIDNPSATSNPTPLEGDTFRVDGIVFSVPGSVYYRVTVRTDGPRNTSSFIQAMLTISI